MLVNGTDVTNSIGPNQVRYVITDLSDATKFAKYDFFSLCLLFRSHFIYSSYFSLPLAVFALLSCYFNMVIGHGRVTLASARGVSMHQNANGIQREEVKQ